MTISQQIEEHLHAQPEPKRSDMQTLHGLIVNILPEGKLWFEDGKNPEGKVISNPSVGYGSRTLTYANGLLKNISKSASAETNPEFQFTFLA
jgi:hypothetical protein